ncbi:MAG: hypothetical protein IID39_07500 [Planctomycetes bacterium]|nr:hypothetical protein [Planctomycetota bacterium]
MVEPLDHLGALDLLRTNITQPELPTTATYVRIMSLHKSKGLTARVVVVVGCVAGALPTIKGDLEGAAKDAHLAEQRRLDISEMELERRLSKDAPKEGAPEGVSKSLPKDFNRIVEQIYGTNLDAQNEPADVESPAPNPP